VKLAIIGDEISQDLDLALALIQRHGFQGIEIRSLWNTHPHKLSPEQCRRIRDRVGSVGIELVAFGSPAFKRPLPHSSKEEDAALRVLERSLGVARALGNPPMRIFSFYRQKAPCPEAAAEVMARIFDRLSWPDLPLLLENGTRSHTPTVTTLLELLDMLGPWPLKALWDPGNAAFSGLEKTPPLKAYQALQPRLHLIHVKDPQASHSYTRLGRGDLPWQEIVNRLAVDNFDGYLSLETHWRPNRILSQEQRDCPWGSSFSSGGYGASDLCMAALKEMALAAGEFNS
jgi:sugar phosphate isomerase/epimerase